MIRSAETLNSQLGEGRTGEGDKNHFLICPLNDKNQTLDQPQNLQ